MDKNVFKIFWQIKNHHISSIPDTPKYIHIKFGSIDQKVLEKKSFEKLLMTTDDNEERQVMVIAHIGFGQVSWQGRTHVLKKDDSFLHPARHSCAVQWISLLVKDF